MRSGRYDSAIDYARGTAATRPLAGFLQTYYNNNGILGIDQLAMVVDAITTLETTDIYHRAILAVLARYNMDLDVLQSGSLEDYLWIKLKLVNMVAHSQSYHDLPDYQYITFAELRLSFSNSDPTAFKGRPLLYTFALTATLCYSEAIQFLHSQGKELEAVHLAIVLRSRSLLPHFMSELALFEYEGEVLHVNYNELLRKYVQHLEFALPNCALAYIGIMDISQTIVIAASDIVISTQNYQIILNNEVYILSSLFKQKLGNQIYNDIVKRVAHYAVDQNVAEAVRLFDFIDEKADVMNLIIKQEQAEVRKCWSLWHDQSIQDIRPSKAPSRSREFFKENYARIFEKYNCSSASMQNSMYALRGLDVLLNFYTWLIERHYAKAVELILTNLLLPDNETQTSEVPDSIKRAHQAVKEELPDAIFTTLTVLDHFSRQQDPTFPADIAIREMKALCTYYNELEGLLRGLPVASKKWKELSKQVLSYRLKAEE